MKKTAAVIVTYNRKELLSKCLEHLRIQTVPLDVLVIDNASTDGTWELFQNPDAGILYYNTGENLGGAGGFNFGIRKAVELGYDFLWVMDDDTMPNQTAHEKFIEADKRLQGQYGFLSGKVLWKDGSICVMNEQKITKWKRISDFDKEQKIQYASFVSLFMRSEMVKTVGLPYKDFFIWADDWEYTRRISKNNACYYEPESIVHHYCVSNVGADIINAPKDRIDRFKYMYRNDVCLYRLDGFEGKLYLFVRTILHTIRIVIKADYKKEKLRIMFKSLKEGKSFKPEIEFVGDEK